MSITLADFLTPLKTQNVQVVVKDLNLNNLAKLYADSISQINTTLSERTVNRWDIIRFNMIVVYLDDNGDTPVIPVESVSINETSIEITLDGMYQLVATVLPEDATDKTVTWITTDENIATVNNGVVTAVSEGTAIIYASAGDMISDGCTVTVSENIVHVESVQFVDKILSLNVGETKELEIEILPENATDKSVSYSSSDETVASIENNTVTALKEGMIVITVTTIDGGLTDSCALTVIEPIIQVESVTLNQNTLDLEVGSESVILTATVLPENATDKTVTWASDNESVATVENGVVTVISPGIAVITASAGDIVSEPCIVTVTESVIHVESITLNESEMNLTVGEEPSILTATIIPENATDKTLVWHSSNEDIVTVENGILTIIGVGSSNITATADGVESNICVVNVSEP